jgi:hypothetical protein
MATRYDSHHTNQPLHRSTKGLLNNEMPFFTGHEGSSFQQHQQQLQRKSSINPTFNVLF